MNIYISYFYQIRFFKHNMIPISTAAWDPRWYHDFKGKDYVFKDKNGVYNGLRADILAPGKSCHNLCNGYDNCLIQNPKCCDFLKYYRKQLDEINFSSFISILNELGNSIKSAENFPEEPEIVLIVYETPDNLCSERGVLKEWFSDNGYKLQEWYKH